MGVEVLVELGDGDIDGIGIWAGGIVIDLQPVFVGEALRPGRTATTGACQVFAVIAVFRRRSLLSNSLTLSIPAT